MPGRIRKKADERRASDRISGGRALVSRKKPSLAEFLEKEIRTDDGAYTFEGREALREVVDHLDEILRLGLPERIVSVLKGTQIGMTTVAIGLALYAVHVRRLNVGYFLPDQDFANRFDDTRVRPAIRRAAFRARVSLHSYNSKSNSFLRGSVSRGGGGSSTRRPSSGKTISSTPSSLSAPAGCDSAGGGGSVSSAPKACSSSRAESIIASSS